MELEVIGTAAVKKRKYWVEQIYRIGGDFGQDTKRVTDEVSEEVGTEGAESLRDHLRLCGAIPGSYGHDTTAEKLYSKYTDVLIHLAFQYLGITSTILTERADAADVEVVAARYSFVADAKAFRLSRTAKNQKDFKIQAMDTWKRGKPYAVVVCPLYQLPARHSQIYKQAIERNVCVLSYSHVCILVTVAEMLGRPNAETLLNRVLETVDTLLPSKDALDYWTAINRCFVGFDEMVRESWRVEKLAASDSLGVAKEEALETLAREREAIMRMSREEAVKYIMDLKRLDNRERVINAVSDNGLMSVY